MKYPIIMFSRVLFAVIGSCRFQKHGLPSNRTNLLLTTKEFTMPDCIWKFMIHCAQASQLRVTNIVNSYLINSAEWNYPFSTFCLPLTSFRYLRWTLWFHVLSSMINHKPSSQECKWRVETWFIIVVLLWTNTQSLANYDMSTLIHRGSTNKSYLR